MKKKAEKGCEEFLLPRGFRAAGIHAGIKQGGVKDMALFLSDTPAVAAGTFTTNQVKAAPVRLDMERLKGRRARAIVVNSGNANACNGPRGMRDAKRMSALTAEQLGVPESQVFEGGIRALAAAVSAQGGPDAVEAIMTTDTRPKRWSVPVRIGGRTVTVAGTCKGAGMIEPKMATMLCFLVTDAAVAPRALQQLLGAAVQDSFNRITVDGDRSTNDTVLFLANGQAGNPPLAPGRPGWAAFAAAVREVTHHLALAIVRDGEGASRFVTIRVRGARNAREADLAARSVANSFLVKTAWAGKNANWGRVMDALGYSEAKVVEEKVEIRFDELHAVRRGAPGAATPEQLQSVIARPEFTVDIDLRLGKGGAIVYTCNCTEEYVRINV